jgi:hypothetical protein
MKASSSVNAGLMRAPHDAYMQIERRPADDLLDVVRALLLMQGAILIATTIEAVIWGVVFSGAPGVPALMSGAAAALVLAARLRLRPDRRRMRRLVYVVESVILVSFAIDSALAIALAHALPPVAAIFTDGVLPLAVLLLLRRSADVKTPRPVGGAGLVAAR